MNKFALCLALLSFFSLSAFAKIEILTPIKAESEITAWTQSFAATVNDLKKTNYLLADGYTECREVLEISDAFLCQSNTQTEMNYALARATFFVEGIENPNNKGKIKKHDDPVLNNYYELLSGHDLRGQDLLQFHQKVQEQCAASHGDYRTCYNPYEEDLFQNFILGEISKRKNFVVITFSNGGGADWHEVVTHEIMHAQYFNQKKFESIVNTFWEKEVSENDKKAIRATLGQYYNGNDDLLIRNEFQAYILMAGAEASILSKYVSKYRYPLFQRLAQSGIKPIQVK